MEVHLYHINLQLDRREVNTEKILGSYSRWFISFQVDWYFVAFGGHVTLTHQIISLGFQLFFNQKKLNNKIHFFSQNPAINFFLNPITTSLNNGQNHFDTFCFSDRAKTDLPT